MTAKVTDGPTLETYVETRFNLVNATIETTVQAMKDLMFAKHDSLTGLIEERHSLYNERSAATNKAMEAALTAAKEAVQAALQATKEAAEKTEMALKEYKTGANEWRDTVKDLVSRMPTRDEISKDIQSLTEKIADLRETRTQYLGLSGGARSVMDQGRANIALIVSLIVVAILLYRVFTGN